MRIRFFVLPLALFLCNYSRAQEHFIDRMDIISGVSNTKFIAKNIDVISDPTWGFFEGVGISYLNHTYWNINSNLAFCQKNGKENLYDYAGYVITLVYINGPPNYGHVKKNFYLNYLSFNTNICFKYPIYDLMVPYIRIGPRLDYLVQYTDVFYNDLKKINYGILVGMGIEKKYSKRIDLSIELIKNFNLNKIEDHSEINDKTIVFDVRIGYKLNIKERKLPPLDNLIL
jgi:hypothetical protein